MHHAKLDRERKARRHTGPLHNTGQATLADVAAAAGVSQMTVSRVINHGPVSERTRRTVQQALDELKYKPNEAARALAANRKAHGSAANREDLAATPHLNALWAPYGQFIAEMWKPRS